MPIYQFQCSVCENLFDSRQPVGTVTIDCQTCNGTAHKLFSPKSIQFLVPIRFAGGRTIQDQRDTVYGPQGEKAFRMNLDNCGQQVDSYWGKRQKEETDIVKEFNQTCVEAGVPNMQLLEGRG